MNDVKTGGFDRYDATYTHSLQGAVTESLIVRGGVTFSLYGSQAGEVVVEPDAVLQVFGTFSGKITQNDGLIMISGVVTEEPWRRGDCGRLTLSAGSLSTAGSQPRRLNADGSWDVVREKNITVNNADVTAKDFLYFDHDRAEFVPLDALNG